MTISPSCVIVILFAVFIPATLGFSKQDDFEKQYEQAIQQLQSQIDQTRSAQTKEMLQKSLEQFQRRELTVNRRLTSNDRWELVDIQFASEQGNANADKNGFGFRRQNQNQDNPGTSSYRVTIADAPPKSLRPGQVFDFSVETNSTVTGSGRILHPPLKFYRASGQEIFNERKLTELNHVNEDGSNSKNWRKRTTTLAQSPERRQTLTQYRVKFPSQLVPWYIRFGVTVRNNEGRHRIVYVYKLREKKAETTRLLALDANPQFNLKKLPTRLRATELINADTVRAGTIADGVSQLIIRAELPNANSVKFRLNEEIPGRQGILEPLLNGRTVTLGEKHYAFAIYTPPQKFGGGSTETKPTALFHPDAQPNQRLEEVVEFRSVDIDVQSQGQTTQTLTMKLARPPAVLVHGFLSDPYNCWVATKDSGTSMTVLLEKAGIMPFLVNYQQTNGTPLKASTASSFLDNKLAVWDRADPFNYKPVYEGWFVRKEVLPILGDFQRAKPKRIGGIKQALTHFRNHLNLAATQADVIGHSMGGLLSRVYASDEFNPTYKRAENYFHGDIHRLITINTPHFGSELAHLYDALLKGWVDDESWLDWGIRRAPQMLGWMAGVMSPAAIDLTAPLTIDEPSALRKIGETQIPSFAISTEANHNQLLTSEYDQHLMYRNLFGTVGMVFFHNRPLLKDFAKTRGEQWLNAPADLQIQSNSDSKSDSLAFNSSTAIDDYVVTINRNMESDVYYWLLRRENDYVRAQARSFSQTKIYDPELVDVSRNLTPSPKGVSDTLFDGLSTVALGGRISVLSDVSKEPDVPPIAIAQIRDLIFHNDHRNDGAVRVISQQGGLQKPHTKNFSGVLHSFSPWHYLVQKQVIELLKWDDHLFAQNGFPEAGQLMPRYMPNQRSTEDRIHGELAVRWSGVVPSHAQAYASVADEMDAVILVRPVNQDSTKLIAANNATKAMAVKGKSSNWGPQTGFIPVRQRYSKLWMVHKDNPKVRDIKIKEFDSVTQKMLGKRHPTKKDRFFAIARPLRKLINGVDYLVLTNPDQSINDAEKEIFLYANGQFLDIQLNDVTANIDSSLAETLQENPMMVLADGVMDGAEQKEPPLYLTADYDLLAIGIYEEAEFKHGKPDEVDNVPFDPLMGFVLPRQREIIKALNDAVRERANYLGGDVTHHGPEVQYADSPYVDYPILVCDPGEPNVYGDSRLFIIRQGPPGFRDIHLKRYFTEQIRKRFRLWPNPDSQGWLWQGFDPISGYDSRDSANLLPYVDEQPRPDIKESGSTEKESSVKKLLQVEELGELKELAEQGDPQAQVDLAVKYYEGDGTEQNLQLYRKWVERASYSGSSVGDVAFAQALLDGIGGPADPERAIQLIKNAIARDQFKDAYLELGYIYENGIGVEPDVVRAFGLYQEASDRGSAYANYLLGELTYAGIFGKPDMQKAFEYFQQAANEDVSQAHAFLGLFYHYGTLGEKDSRLAMDHYRRAIDLSDDIEAKLGMGRLLLERQPADRQNSTQAFQLIREAAESGLPAAARDLSNCFLRGIGVERNPVMAYVWLKLAVTQSVSNDVDEQTLAAIYRTLTPQQKREADTQFEQRIPNFLDLNRIR